MHFPQNTLLWRPNIPFWGKGDLQATPCPALSRDWVRLHLKPLTPISCTRAFVLFLGAACREMPAHLLCRSGDGWRCHVSSNALRGIAALREITPAHQIRDIMLLTLTILSFITEDPYNQLPLPVVFGNNKTLQIEAACMILFCW